ncbi:MAG: hypothetical protein K8S24_09785 [Candidatus Aegiribacteria sp.]|nr:hypothetical protein [Candidatus Aegiribacteria sp.]
MTILMLLLCTIGQSPGGESDSFSPGFRIGFSFMTSFPSMQNEKDFADMNTASGLDFELGHIAFGGSLELLGDLSEKIRIRGSFGGSHFSGGYSEGYNVAENMFMVLFTLGLISLSGEDEVIELDDQAITLEAQAYYFLSRTPKMSISVGAGPIYTFATRKLESPNTSTSGNGSGLGFVASIRMDQESTFNLGCLPLMFGLEGGYRVNSVNISNEEADDYELDFSGPFVKVGSYIGI